MKALLAHQSDSLAFLRRRGWRGALFLEPGLGKTRVGYEIARRARRTLVFAPLNPVLFVWPEQRQLWAPDLSFAVVRGTPAQRERILYDERPQVAVINYELIHWLYDVIRRRRKLPYDVALLDESTAVKSSNSVSFRALKALEPAFDAMIPMTGTPAANSLHDIWSQLWFVDKGSALGERIGVFRERYCTPVMRENYVTWKVTRAAELRRHAAPLCFVRRAVDCLKMPPLVFRDVLFKLSPKEAALYDSVAKHHVLKLDTAIALKNAGTAYDKLRQVSSGFAYDEERVAHFVGDSKARALVEALDESFGQPALIGFWYRGSKLLIKKALGYDVPTIDRFTTLQEKQRLLDLWRKGELPHLLGQVKTVALGLNMQSPEAGIVFYDLPWSHELHWQFIRRVWRQGQATRVVARRLIADRPIDRYVANVLSRKQNDERLLTDTILEEELI